MKTPQKGIKLIKYHESFRAKWYLCAARKPTIGYGHVILPFEQYLYSQILTLYQGEDLLRRDLIKFERAVSSFVKVPVFPEQFGALVSFAFNLGTATFARSTLRMKLNRREYTDAANEFTKWVYATVNGKKAILKGLIKRRIAERNLFLSES